MRRVPIWTFIPLILLAACQSGQTGAPPAAVTRDCTQRLIELGPVPDIFVLFLPRTRQHQLRQRRSREPGSVMADPAPRA